MKGSDTRTFKECWASNFFYEMRFERDVMNSAALNRPRTKLPGGKKNPVIDSHTASVLVVFAVCGLMRIP